MIVAKSDIYTVIVYILLSIMYPIYVLKRLLMSEQLDLECLGVKSVKTTMLSQTSKQFGCS